MMTERYFEDISVGDCLMRLEKGPMSPVHIMRWSAAIENFHRIHYDYRFATEHDGLPDLLVNGSWKQHVMVQLMKDGLGKNGWLWKIKFRFLKMNVVWDTIRTEAIVGETKLIDEFGIIKCDLIMTNQDGVASTEGTALGVMQRKGGPAIPYPFDVSQTFKETQI